MGLFINLKENSLFLKTTIFSKIEKKWLVTFMSSKSCDIFAIEINTKKREEKHEFHIYSGRFDLRKG